MSRDRITPELARRALLDIFLSASTRNADLGLAREVSDETQRQRGSHLPAPNGFAIPFAAFYRAGLDSASSGKGAELKFDGSAGIEMLTSVSPVLRRARTVRAKWNPQTIPVQTAGSTVTHIAENPGSDTSISELTLDSVSASMLTALVATQATLQLRKIGLGTDEMMLSDLRKVLALAMESKAINGSGSDEPLGLLNNTNVGTTTLGANGATVSGTDLAELVRSVEDADVCDVEASGAFITNPKQRKVFSITERASGNGFLYAPAGVLDKWPLVVTPRAPSNLTKGTATTICSAIVFGAMDQLIVTDWAGGVDIMLDPYTKAAQAVTRVVATAYYNVVPARGSAFRKIVDARNPA